jgi:hypothetical protein
MSNPLAALASRLGWTADQQYGYNTGLYGVTSAPAATTSITATSLKDRALGVLAASSRWLPGIGVTAAVIAAILLVLVVIHYTYRPIFRFSPESSGIIRVPFTSTGAAAATYWTADSDKVIADATTPLGTHTTYNYSIALDIIISNPMEGIGAYRPIFVRGPAGTRGRGSTIQAALGDHNLAIVADKDKNDLIVSTQVVAPSGETELISALIHNVPIQQPFTIAVVLGVGYLEVYMNGKLRQTKSFLSVPRAIAGPLSPPAAELAGFAKVRNLRVWAEPASPAVIRDLAAPSRAIFGELVGISSITTAVCSA